MWRMLSGGAEVTGEATLPASVPAPLVDLITACVRREASERPSAGEAARALEPLVASPSGTSALPQARPPTLQRWLTSNTGA